MRKRKGQAEAEVAGGGGNGEASTGAIMVYKTEGEVEDQCERCNGKEGEPSRDGSGPVTSLTKNNKFFKKNDAAAP